MNSNIKKNDSITIQLQNVINGKTETTEQTPNGIVIKQEVVRIKK
jgi:hypothetical protein